MIPRRDIRLYNRLSGLIFSWIFNCEKENYPEKFTQRLSFYFEDGSVFLTGGGRQVFHLVFDNVNFDRGDEVVVPNYYLPVLVPIIKSKGLVPVFCDIDKSHLSVARDGVLEKISSDTRFVVIPHMFGHMGDVKSLVKEIKDKKEDVLVIEDCAHAFGSENKDGKAGTFGDFSLFSFNYIKTLNTLEGGALLVNNEKYSQKIKKDYNHNYKRQSKSGTVKKIVYYYFLLLVFKTPILIVLNLLLKSKRVKSGVKEIHNSHSKNWKKEKLSPFLSYIGYNELLDFEEKQKIITESYQKYREKLNDNILEKQPKGTEVVWSKYFLTLIMGEDSSTFNDKLFKRGIDVAIKDEVMGVCKWDDELGCSLDVYSKIIQLPLHHKLSDSNIKRISENINYLT